MTGECFRYELLKIKEKMIRGEISYDEAKKEASPIIDKMNCLARDIAKKYGKNHKNFSFSQIMR